MKKLKYESIPDETYQAWLEMREVQEMSWGMIAATWFELTGERFGDEQIYRAMRKRYTLKRRKPGPKRGAHPGMNQHTNICQTSEEAHRRWLRENVRYDHAPWDGRSQSPLAGA